MSKLLNDLVELVEAQVLSEENAQRIREYYARKSNAAPNRLFIVFGILGALLVGLGIILIIAHNWDNLGKATKLSLALLPLLLAQGVCAFVLLKKRDSVAWREGSSVFLIMAIACSISIVSQVYNIEGSLEGFLWLWMILSLPVMYVMQSSLASLLYLIGITWYACEASYFGYPTSVTWWYWGFLLLVLPYYYQLLRKKSTSNFFYFHSWAIAISLTITLGMFADILEEYTILTYVNVFSIFILFGQIEAIKKSGLLTNGFLITGSLGTIAILLSLSFEWYWEEIFQKQSSVSPGETIILWITVFMALAFLLWMIKKHSFTGLNAKSYTFLLTIGFYLISLQSPKLAQVLTNVALLALGVFTIRDGAMQNRLGLLNYGLLILTALITCRFFDTDISFVARGLLFVIVGVGFFFANYWLIKKRKDQSSLPG